MSKSRVTSTLKDKPVKWPQPTPSRAGTEMNGTTKMPPVKTNVVGGNFQ